MNRIGVNKMYADEASYQTQKLEVLCVPEAINEIWSVDFMYDAPVDGRSFLRSTCSTILTAKGSASRLTSRYPRIALYVRWTKSSRGAVNLGCFGWTTGVNIYHTRSKNQGKTSNLVLQFILPGKPELIPYIERSNRTVRIAMNTFTSGICATAGFRLSVVSPVHGEYQITPLLGAAIDYSNSRVIAR